MDRGNNWAAVSRPKSRPFVSSRSREGAGPPQSQRNEGGDATDATTQGVQGTIENNGEPIGRIVIHDSQIVLEMLGAYRPLLATEVFSVAVRGASSVDGVSISPDVDATAPGVVFHAQPARVGLHISVAGDEPVCRVAVLHRGQWVAIDEPTLDHVLVDKDWYPLDETELAGVRAWLSDHDERPLSAAAYLELYRGLNSPFELIDELPAHVVERLAGGKADTSGITAQLYPYQVDGLLWLSARANAALGGILADEMGLGKTLQVIALLVQRQASAGIRRPHLVIVPTTLMENWTRELARFAPTVHVYRHVGGARTRRPSELAKGEVVLTTYDTAVIDLPILEAVAWDVVVVDEAQAIKNPDTQRWKAFREIPRTSAFAVTGTPLENRTLDTWSLSEFALPGYLGTRGSFGLTLEAEPSLLAKAIRPLILRREVRDVAADLPPKIEADVALEMFAEERALYDSVRKVVRRERRSVPILALITKLRMFTAHPDCVFGTAPRPEERSAKLARLIEILQELSVSGSKSLVFAAFTAACDIIATTIQRVVGAPAWIVDGRVAVPERQLIIDRFSELNGPAVLVLNPAAGGVGLNIQAASHVVHHTLEWNPAREAQATARAWRRGQRLPVRVHRLFYVSSIDEVILERLEMKRELFSEVVRPTAEEGEPMLKELLEKALSI